MGQTTIHQIEAQIDRTREQLGTNLHELSRRVESATDWQEYYRSRPFVFLGAAAVGGALAAIAINVMSSRQNYSSGSSWSESRSAYNGGGGDSPSRQVSEFWRNMQSAVVGLAAARLKDYLENLLPGFNDQYQRVERHAADGNTGRHAPMDLSQR